MAAVQSIFEQWKTFDLTNLQKELDETASELANRQDESENSRKKLVDQSRDFKKNTPEEIRKQVTPLLKSFQAEIDSLSKRSKAAEASFLTLYKKIVETPDPVPAMEQMMQTFKKAQRCNELELENKNLRSTLDQYNAEFAEVRNQEVTIRQLKERIKLLEEQTDSIVDARVIEQETASKRFYDERERELRDENESLSQKLKETEERSQALQTSLNASQNELFVLRSRGDEFGSAKASELELISADVERANQRADTAEKECELLRDKIKILEETGRQTEPFDNDDSREKKSKTANHALELSAKEKQIGQLLEELKHVNAKLIDGEKRHQSEHIELTRQLDEAQQRIQILETSLKEQEDYDEIKRELNILKSIELGEQHDDGNESYDGIKMQFSDGKTTSQKSLETLLLEKNKALQDENASLRNANREMNESSSSPSLSAVYRNLSDEQFNALIAGINEQNQFDQSDTSPIQSTDMADYLQKKDSSSRSSTGAPLQNVVKRMACLIGTELVAKYQASDDQGSDDSPNISTKRVENVIESHLKGKSNDANQPPPPDPTMIAMAMDLLTCLRSPTPAGFEEALASGVPREVVEYVALYHLQQSVAKKVAESAAKGEILDTALVAQRCRIALSTHNIGQRLIAKCILNQSQGSVSELLSKPKPWEKLTEKGKESFRRIQAWLSEDAYVELLRMISPKRAYGGFRERYPPKQEDISTHDKVNAILSEAAQNAHSKFELSSFFTTNDQSSASLQLNHNNGGDYSPESRQTSTPNSGTNTSSKNAMTNRSSSGRYRHDDIPKEMVYEIYRRELEKLQAQEGSGGGGSTSSDVRATNKLQASISNVIANKSESRSPVKRGFNSSSSLLARPSILSSNKNRHRRPEPKRLSGLSLSFMQRRQHSNTTSSMMKNNALLAIRQRSLFANSRRAENRAGMRLPPVRPSWSASRAKFVSPGVIRVDDTANTTTPVKSPIASSSDEIPQSFSPGGTPIVGTRAFKAILPPISQEQFEEYNNIDTEDLVRKIKDYLTKYSISQRLFGEQVLGLSQGSVSDLLARPKLWSMLTQKGREPFIRMQLFLSDKKALQKLMEKRQQQIQSQQNSADEGEIGDSINDDANLDSITSPVSLTLPVAASSTAGRSRRKPILPRASVTDKEANRPRELSGIAALLQVAIRGGAGNRTTPAMSMVPKTTTTTSQPTHTPRRYIPTSTIQESIDTKAVVTKVKSLLLAHNIGQKVFGATVLDMSQGAVSDLLSKTKPWELLSARGREAMIRMKAWLEDPNRLEKVFQGRAPSQPKAIVERLEKENSNMNETLSQQNALIAKLEDDLLSINTLRRPEAVGAESPDDVTRDFLTKAVSPTSDRTTDSLLPIIAGQRERFRQRVQELEEQNLQYQQHLALLQTEMDRSRTDNVKLYEKIKFLQSYRGNGNQTSLQMTDDQTMEKYSSEYERSLDPFRRFGVQERQRKYQALRTHDKATLGITRMIMSSGAARAFFFFYLLFLHCLVFLVLYKTAYTESCKRDFNTECVQKFREHMHQVHGHITSHHAD